MLGFVTFLIGHRWAIPLALAVGLLLSFGYLKIQNNHLRSELASTQVNLETATATALANAEAIRKMAAFQDRQQKELNRVEEEQNRTAQVADEIRGRMNRARKTGADGPIAPAVRDGLNILYGAPRAAGEGGVPKPHSVTPAPQMPASPTP